MYGMEPSKIEFEIQWCSSDERVIAKMSKPWLKFETEKGQVKECMIK